VTAAFDAASEMCTALGSIGVPWSTVVKDVVVPPDVVADFPTSAVVDAVSRVTRISILDKFAQMQWQGEEALHVVLKACEELALSVVKVCFKTSFFLFFFL
jgi:hypothetical protein